MTGNQMKYVILLQFCILSLVQVRGSSYHGKGQSGTDYPYNNWSTLQSVGEGT